MRKQIGWYRPEGDRFCYNAMKDSEPLHYASYTIPVFADDKSEQQLSKIERKEIVKVSTLNSISIAIIATAVIILTVAFIVHVLSVTGH